MAVLVAPLQAEVDNRPERALRRTVDVKGRSAAVQVFEHVAARRAAASEAPPPLVVERLEVALQAVEVGRLAPRAQVPDELLNRRRAVLTINERTNACVGDVDSAMKFVP